MLQFGQQFLWLHSLLISDSLFGLTPTAANLVQTELLFTFVTTSGYYE